MKEHLIEELSSAHCAVNGCPSWVDSAYADSAAWAFSPRRCTPSLLPPTWISATKGCPLAPANGDIFATKPISSDEDASCFNGSPHTKKQC
jgi:hypothetical protein